MASETMRRLDEIVGSFREGVIVRVSCGGMLCGECIQCTARAAKASLQREQRAAQDEIDRLTRELEEARKLIRELVDREPICVALRSKYVEVRIDGGTWDDARRFVGLDPAGDDDVTPPAGDAPAHPVAMAQPDEGLVL